MVTQLEDSKIVEDLKNVDLNSQSPVDNVSDDDEDYEGTNIGEILIIRETTIKKMMDAIPCYYTNIVGEFADVEIFLISVESMLIEFTAHSYHNWTLGGQTIIFAEQINRFLGNLVSLGAKFKLIVFKDMAQLFDQDTILSFYYHFMLAYLKKSVYAKHLEYFNNPIEDSWSEYLANLTPSFMLMSIDNAPPVVSNNPIDFFTRFRAITCHLIYSSIPVVSFSGFKINVSSVMAYRFYPCPIQFPKFYDELAKEWNLAKVEESPKISLAKGEINNVADMWMKIFKDINTNQKNEVSDNFESLVSAVFLFSLVSEKKGVERSYSIEDKSFSPGPSLIKDRKVLLISCAKLLKSIDVETLPFDIKDIWDGRLIQAYFSAISNKKSILPYRLQEAFAKYHIASGLIVPLQVDNEDKLLDSPSNDDELLLRSCSLVRFSKSIFNGFIEDIASEVDKTIDNQSDQEEEIDYAGIMESKKRWKFKPVQDNLIKQEDKNMNHWAIKKRNRQKQQLYKWYQNFSDSLEGRRNELLVDFTRNPIANNTETPTKNEKTNKDGKAKKGGGKPGSKGAVSKKDQILEANRQKKLKEQFENDSIKIQYALQVKGNQIATLESVYRKLELPQSKAVCAFEIAQKMASNYIDSASTNVEERRIQALELIGQLKQCFALHYENFDNKQKEKIDEYWALLGFSDKTKNKRLQSQLTLDIDLIYYQLEYAGRYIDVLSDPKKDNRVTGFSPDKWQRDMLDAVDSNNSALIIAPTSAGKTFVSYYAIEKILRSSDDDMVVYVSPSKALMNQFCGSVYARFRNKTLSGGKSLFGVLMKDYSDRVNSCQVLVTIPECFEEMLLLANPEVQKVVSRIKYVIFDEVHCISAPTDERNIIADGRKWEILLSIIKCPFLALSATISNVDILHQWMQCLENAKAADGETPRKVVLIQYSERFSELELGIQKLETAPSSFDVSMEKKRFTDPNALLSASITPICEEETISLFMPYGIFEKVKLEMFGIPEDQQLTAKQILQLYNVMSIFDENTKDSLEPIKFFGAKKNENKLWLNRDKLRSLENELKKRFMHLLETDEEKFQKVLKELKKNVETEFEKRSKPFNMIKEAVYNIVPLVDQLKNKEMIPAICFNDDREVCELLAMKLYNCLSERQKDWMESPEYKNKYDFKNEEKFLKIQEKKAAAEKARKEKKLKDHGIDEDQRPGDVIEDTDPYAIQRIKLKKDLKRFSLQVREGDEELYTQMLQKLNSSGDREKSKMVARLIERGIGIHHEGLNPIERGAVESLFRAGYIGVVFSTSTLALGLNMPCKTVIFGIDTPQLNPLQFRQMSGRAGRRGFDHAGTVIFMSVPTSKIRRLLTASLSTLRGNVPFTTTMLLRLVNFINMEDGEEVKLPAGSKKKDKNSSKVETSKELRIKAVCNLLQNFFLTFTKKTGNTKALKNQFKSLAAFSIEVLRKVNLLDNEGKLTKFAPLACCLSDFEPGNIILTHLIQTGSLHRLLKKFGEDKEGFKDALINIFAHLFTSKKLPLTFSEEKNLDHITLKPMVPEVQKQVDTFNEEINTLLVSFLELGLNSGEKIQSDVFSITGLKKSELSLYKNDIVPPLHKDIVLDEALLPTSGIDAKSHRLESVKLNSYAYDFWKSGFSDDLLNVNLLLISEYWFAIHDFSNVLLETSRILSTIGNDNDTLISCIKELANEYHIKFIKAFNMKMKKND
uniref:Helicase ATP-binding domain-containing protein n=1 Tax=Strongyloides papillosus TaxID=174720 RepID=A0A0N5BAM6_STREA